MAAKKKTVKKAKPKPLAPLSQRVGSDPALLAKALANPGLRSKLPDKYLTPQLREGRRLNAPLVAGGSLTNRQAESQAQAAVDLKYGPNAQAKQEQQNRDVLGWYDQYKADLANHAKNIGDINSQANTAISGLSSGIRPLADQALAEQKAREGQQAGVTGSTPQDQTKTASDASAVRQAMIAALGSAEASRGSARQSYADTLANVVAPGYKLQAGAQGQQSLRDLILNQGATKADVLGQLATSESKNATDRANQAAALQILGIKNDAALTQTKIKTAASTANAAAGRAQSAAEARAGRAVTKRGQTLSHEDRVAARKAAAAKAAKQKAAAKKAPRYGPGSLTQQEENTVASRIDKQVGKLNAAGAKGQGVADSAIINALLQDGLSRDEAHVVVSLYRNRGALGPDGVRAAHAAGLRVKGRYPVRPPSLRQTVVSAGSSVFQGKK